MKIERERACRNRYHEVNAPLDVKFPWGQKVRAEKWSLGGIKVKGLLRDEITIGDKFSLNVELPFQGFDINFDVDAVVCDFDQTSNYSELEFVDLSERAHDLMVHFLDDLIRGKMATVEDTICRIDVPVTPISTKPDPKDEVDALGRTWSIKPLLMTGFYGVFGCLVFGYLGILIYSNTMRVEVQSAVISAPVTTVKMPVDGLLTSIRFEKGAMVEEGDAIAKIKSPNMEAKIEDKKIELQTANRVHRRIQEKYRIEKSRMNLYQIVSRTERQIAEARVDAARSALKAADESVERLTKLYKKNLVTISKFELSKKLHIDSEQRLRRTEHDLEQKIAMERASDRRYFNHKEFVSDLDMLALEVSEAAERVETVSLQLSKLEQQKESMVVRAPYDGRIVAVMQVGNTTVLRNSNLFSIEKSSAMSVTAFLNQDEVLKIGLKDNAKVYLPALGVEASATVEAVDRSSVFLDAERSHYTWKEGKEKSAVVSLHLNIPEDKKATITAGMPVVVIFPRRSISHIKARFWRLIENNIKAENHGTPI